MLLGLALAISTCLGAGYVPVAPGTAGSAVALPLAWLLGTYLGGWGIAAGAVIFLLIGTWAANLAERHYAVHDSPHIVVDELVGQLISLIPVSCAWPNLVVGFGWFRLFDTVKPWPAGWIDRNIPGGLGVMLDDVAAGIYAAGATAMLVYSGLVDRAVSLLFC